MRKGKISENILKRSVLKTIKYKNQHFIKQGAAPGGDASVTVSGNVMASASAGLMFGAELLRFDIKRAFYNALNNVAAEGGKPEGVIVNLVLPKRTQEQDIKELMRYISGLCKDAEIEIAGGDTEVTEHVTSEIINFTAFGTYLPAKCQPSPECHLPAEYQLPKEIAEVGMDIVMAGEIALSGTAAIAYLKNEELLERFQRSYLEKAFCCEQDMSIVKTAMYACDYGVRIMHDLSRGGIHSALWELSEKADKGVEVIQDAIPVRQETIELTEQYNINPYKLLSNGALLMVCENGADLVEYLAAHGIAASVIGKLTDNNDKVILKNEEKRYIEPPKGDQIYLLL